MLPVPFFQSSRCNIRSALFPAREEKLFKDPQSHALGQWALKLPLSRQYCPTLIQNLRQITFIQHHKLNRANFMSPSKEGKFHQVKSLHTSGEIFARWKKAGGWRNIARRKNAILWGKFSLEEFLLAEICTALTLKAAC